jgi:CRP/FNR family transcriptional regulator
MISIQYMNILAQLEKASLFRGLSETHLASLVKIAIPKVYKKKHLLFLEKTEGHFIYLLCFGLVRLYKTDGKGREIDIRLIHPGEVFGEVILFEQKHYPVSAVTLKESDILLFPRHDIICMLENKEFRNDFIGILMKKLRYLTGRISKLTSGDVEERFFHFLTEYYGERDEYIITIPKKDLAKAIGTNPETLSRLVARLTKKGILTWEGKRIFIKKK